MEKHEFEGAFRKMDGTASKYVFPDSERKKTKAVEREIFFRYPSETLAFSKRVCYSSVCRDTLNI